MKKYWIAIDWGTSSLRAWLLNEENQIVEARSSNEGVKFVKPKEFPEVFIKITKGWLSKVDDIFTCGMVGSSIGWKMAPYVKIKARNNSHEDFLKSLIKIKFQGKTITIIPGMSYLDCDVMRGEETILLGLSEWIKQKRLPSRYLAILPGTHSKWVEVNKQVKGFNTYLTGELFELLLNHSILKNSLLKQNFNLKSFKEGMNAGKEGMLGNLFKIRAKHLIANSLDGYDKLSGMVLSEEIKNGLQKYYQKNLTVYLLGKPQSPMIRNYQLAFKFYGIKVKVLDVELLTLLGLGLIRNSLNNSNKLKKLKTSKN